MSASTTPTRSPCCAIATARFAVTDDLPTPPLPDATANTLVSEVGLLNGMTGSAPPRSRSVSAARCSGLITPIAIRTSATPSTVSTAAVTSFVIVCRGAHPAGPASGRLGRPAVPALVPAVLGAVGVRLGVVAVLEQLLHEVAQL